MPKLDWDYHGLYVKHWWGTIRPLAPHRYSEYRGRDNSYRDLRTQMIAKSMGRSDLVIIWDGQSSFHYRDTVRERSARMDGAVAIIGNEGAEIWFVWEQPLGWWALEYLDADPSAVWVVLDDYLTQEQATERTVSLTASWQRQGQKVGIFRTAIMSK